MKTYVFTFMNTEEDTEVVFVEGESEEEAEEKFWNVWGKDCEELIDFEEK